VLDQYNAKLTNILSRSPTLAIGSTDVLDPPAMDLSSIARDIFIAFYDAVERDLGESGPLHAIRAFGAKMAEHAGRLAAVLAAYNDPDCMEVDAESMACGVALAQHYAAEMLRLHSFGAIDPDLRLAAKLLAWWEVQSSPVVHLAAVYQLGPGALRDAATARRIVGILEAHGWITRSPKGTIVDGAPRNEVWEMVP
jgi:hypothetical protein